MTADARPYVVGSVERGALAVVGRYATEGEAKRAMRGVGATGHVVYEGSLLATHAATPAHVEKQISKALRDDTHPAVREQPQAPALFRPAPVAPAPAPAAQAIEPAPVPVPEEPAPTEPTTMSIEAHEEEEESVSPELEATRALIARAVSKAGSVTLLAEAIEHSATALYGARTGSKPLGPGLRAKLEGFLAEVAAPVARATPRPALAAAPAAPFSFPTERTLTVTLPESLVRGCYQSARLAGDDKAALLWGDALLGAS